MKPARAAEHAVWLLVSTASLHAVAIDPLCVAQHAISDAHDPVAALPLLLPLLPPLLLPPVLHWLEHDCSKAAAKHCALVCRQDVHADDIVQPVWQAVLPAAQAQKQV